MTRPSEQTTDPETRMPHVLPLFRFALLAVCLTSALLVARPDGAIAGTYDVYACDANVGGGQSPSWGLSADGGHTAYFACPARQDGDGIVVRSVWDNSTSGFLQGAYAVFDAPAGNVVESISAWMFMQRPSCDWSVGVIASGYDLGGTGIHHLPAGYCGANGIGWVRYDLGVNAPRVRIEARCGAGSCARGQTYSGGPGVAEARLKDVRVRVRDDNPPSVGNVGGTLVSGGWVGGRASVAMDASDSAGIRETVVRIDGAEVDRTAKPCNNLLTAPCPNGGLSTAVQTAGIKPDGGHTVTLEAIDAAGNRNAVDRTIYVDNTPPAQPLDLTVAGGDGWRAENDFDLTWKNPAEPGVAPIVGAGYEVCPIGGASSPAPSSTPAQPEVKCVRESKSGANLEKIEDIKLPAPGEYTLKLWLIDAAGNQDVRTAAAPLRLRLDELAPDVAFEPLDPADPTLLKVRSTDRGSGIAQAQIEVKARASATWMPLPTKVEDGRLTTRLGDEWMKDGVYDLRARAVDHAANERTSDTRTDGAKAEVTMPIRIKTRLRVGMKRPRSKKVRYRGKHRVRYGRPVRLVGRLTTPDKNPVADSEVIVYSQARRDGAPQRLLATLKTSRKGGFSFRVPKGVSRTIRVRYGGTANVRSATRDVALLVRARSTIKRSRRSFVNGETLRLSGRLRGGHIPAEGKLVELQVMLRGRYRTFATTRADRRGRWSYGYRFDGTRGRQTYRFRARVPREATYPYETGTSRVAKVKVRGL